MAKKTIGIVCPARVEYESCCKHLGLSGEQEIRGRMFSFRDGDMKLIAVHAGMGKTLVASSVQLLIDVFSPDIILDVGSAGSLGAAIGSIVYCVRGCEHDSYKAKTSSALEDETGSIISLKANSTFFQEVIEGEIVSGDCPIITTSKRERLKSRFPNAVACTMETASVFTVAKLSKVQAVSFRIITDSASETGVAEWKENINPLLEKLFKFLGDVIYGSRSV